MTSNRTIVVKSDYDAGDFSGPFHKATVSDTVVDGYGNPIRDYLSLSVFGTLSNALTAIGGTEVKLLVDIDDTVSADLVVPNNIKLLFNINTITIQPGITLTINGAFYADLFQIFNGDGNVVFGHGVVSEVYPQWWGGKADGVTNDQPAIQKALDSLPDLPPTLTADSDPPTDEYGGIVKLSKGMWKVTSPIQMGSYQWLVGSGAATIIENMTDSTPAVRVGDGTDFAYRVHIRDLTIRGSGSTYVAGGYGIHMKMAMRCYIGPIWIWKTTDSGIYVQGAGYTWIQDSYIQYCKKYGIYTTNLVPDSNYWLTSLTITGCTIRACQYAGIKMDGVAPNTAGQACWILNNIIESNSLNAVVELVGPAGAQTAEGYCMGIYANGITDSIIENNYFEQGAYGWIAPRVQVHVVLSGGYGNRIVKNWFLGNVGLFFWSNGSRINYLNFIESNTFASTATVGLLTANGSSSGFTGNNWYTNNTCMNWKDAGWYNPGTYGHNLTYNLKANMITTQGYVDGMRGRIQTYTHTSGSYSPNYRTITTDDSTESYGVDIGSRRGSTILITLQADINITAPINWTEGSIYTFMFVQDGTGGRDVTFNPAYFDTKFFNFGNSANNTSVVSFIACYPIWKQFREQIPWSGSNADFLDGYAINPRQPQDGYALVYKGSTAEWTAEPHLKYGVFTGADVDSYGISVPTNDTLALWSNKTSGASNVSTEIVANVNSATIDADHKIAAFYWRDNVGTKNEVCNIKDGQIQFTTTASVSMFSGQADGGSSVAIRLGSTNSFVTAGAKILSILNGDPAGLERMNVDYLGNLICNQGDNSQSLGIKYLSELYTVPADASGYSTIQLPANSLIIGVNARVTTVIPTAATFSIGILGTPAKYATGISVAAGTTIACLSNGIHYNTSGTSLLITPDVTPDDATGRIRLTLNYIDMTVPTS